MDTNNTTETTEATTVTEQVELTPLQKAEQFVKESSLTDIAARITQLETKVDQLTNVKDVLENAKYAINSELRNWKTSVSDFIKERIVADSVDLDDLKQFAEEMDIELTKTIRVTCTIEVEGEFTVPLDFDVDSVDDENDFFDIRIDANPSDNDHDIESEQWNVIDVLAEEI